MLHSAENRSFNLLGGLVTVLLLHSKVANTIGGTLAFKAGMVVVIAALLGAIAWNLITWFYGLPSSSSHALVGGLIGAGFCKGGSSVIQSGVAKTALCKEGGFFVFSMK